MTKLYLARHGETPWSLSGQHTGRTEIALTTHGEDQARELGRHLAGITFDAVFSSPLGRARRTAELAGFATPTLTDLLREFDYGDYEGKTTSEIRASRPGWDLFRDGCPGGESPDQVRRRAAAFIGLAGASQGSVLAFGHGHMLRALAVTFIEAGIETASRLAFDTASLSLLQVDERYGRQLAIWNWTPAFAGPG